MKKRPPGTGSVTHHRGEVWARLPRAFGRHWLGPFETDGQAEAELALELERLAEEPPDAETVQGWGWQWFREREAAGHWKSLKRERDRWKHRVEGTRLGRMLVRDVTELDVRRWLAGLRKRDGSRPGGQTLANALSLMKNAMEGAREAGLRADNPAREVTLPKGARRGGGDKWTWFTPAELGALHRAARRLGLRWWSIHVVAAYSGLTPTEPSEQAPGEGEDGASGGERVDVDAETLINAGVWRPDEPGPMDRLDECADTLREMAERLERVERALDTLAAIDADTQEQSE